MRWMPAAAAVALAATAASPQTFEEAVRAKAAIAVQACGASDQCIDAWLGAFRSVAAASDARIRVEIGTSRIFLATLV